MSGRNILCLDLGTTVGWALQTVDGSRPTIISGTVSFHPSRFEGGGMRYLRFNRWLDRTKGDMAGIHEIYFEEVRKHSGVDAAHAYGGFLSTLTSWAELNEIPYQSIPVGTIKKFITGKGNAGKDDVIKAVRGLGHEPEDHNEADAIALLLLIKSRI